MSSRQNGQMNQNFSPNIGQRTDQSSERPWHFNGNSPQNQVPEGMEFKNMTLPMHTQLGGGGFTWEMIGLGLEEPLPPQDTIDDLHRIYFDKVHPTLPMIHKYRYLAAMNL